MLDDRARLRALVEPDRPQRESELRTAILVAAPDGVDHLVVHTPGTHEASAGAAQELEASVPAALLLERLIEQLEQLRGACGLALALHRLGRVDERLERGFGLGHQAQPLLFELVVVLAVDGGLEAGVGDHAW